MYYLEKIDLYINNIISNEGKNFLIKINKNDVPKKYFLCMNPELTIMDEQRLKDLFHPGNYLYNDLINIYGIPTVKDYHSILISFECKIKSVINFACNEFYEIIEDYIELRAIKIIKDINKEKIQSHINKIIKATLIIQREFKKYRYDPKYKYCKWKQMENLYKLDAITKEDFDKYIDEEKININK